MASRKPRVDSSGNAPSERARRSSEKAQQMRMHLWINEEKHQGFFCLCPMTVDHVEDPVFR